MIALCLEFSTDLRSVAVCDLNAEARILSVVRENRSRQFAPIRMIEDALRAASLRPADVAAVILGAGPGSYTGIRSAIAVAQGWELARGVKVLALPSLETLAWRAWKNGDSGPLHLVADAQRGDAYFVTYFIAAGGYTVARDLSVVSAEEAREAAGAGGRVAGPDAARWVSGAADIAPDAADLAGLAAGRKDFLPASQIEPIYLRETAFVKAPPPRAA